MGRSAKGTLAELRPDIAAQLVDPSLATKLAAGSAKVVEWQCALGHRWKAPVYNRTNAKRPTGCPVCNGKRVLVGFNDLATTDPEVAKFCADPEDAYRYTRQSNRKVRWRCEKGHEWEAPVSRLTIQGSRCPVCSGRFPEVGVNDLATTHPELVAEMEDPSLATQLKAGSIRKVWWICSNDPEHRWEAAPYRRTKRGEGCPYCSGHKTLQGFNDLWTTNPELARELVDPELGYQIQAGTCQSVQWRCSKHPSHVWWATPSNRTRAGSGCPFCVNQKVKAGWNDLATTHPEVAKRLADPSLATELVAGSTRRVLWRCDKDSTHTWEAPVFREAEKPETICPICDGRHRSEGEVQLQAVVRGLLGSDVEIEVSKRGVIGSDRELDIYVPSLKAAFEYDGVYWHSERGGKDANYHADKHRRCVDAGIDLVVVWEDDWKDRRDLCVRRVAERLGALERLDKVLPGVDHKVMSTIDADECEASVIVSAEASDFMAKNHLKGSIGPGFHVALRDVDGVIREAMSLRAEDESRGTFESNGDWKIVRHATLGSVVGGFEKLLAFARETLEKRGLPFRSWVALVDNDSDNGRLLEECGFSWDRSIPPAYSYVGTRTGMRRVSKDRAFCDDDLLRNDVWTEHETALNNKLYRVWDAGKERWIRRA